MPPGPLSISVADVKSQDLHCLNGPYREQARSHSDLCWSVFVNDIGLCGSELAREGVNAESSACQNDRTIRPNVSIAFSEASVQGLP